MENKQYKVINPIAHPLGGRVERGEVILLTESEALNFGANVSPVISEKVEVKVEEVSIEKLSLLELRAKAKELDLSTSGSKADLIERISLSLA